MPSSLQTGLGIVLMICLAALVLPLWLPSELLSPSGHILLPPGSQHLMGTTDLGEDVFAQLVHAAGPSLIICFAAGAGTVALGFMMGALAAFGGGMLDRLILRLADILLALPSLVAMMMIASLVQPGLWVLILLLILFEWHAEVRLFRAKLLEDMSRESVDAARICGASGFYLIRRHLLPEAAPLLAVRFVQNGRRAVLKFAGLAFLGLTDPHLVSWGGMLNRGMAYLSLEAWQWWVVPPALALSLLLTALYLIASSIEQKLFVH